METKFPFYRHKLYNPDATWLVNLDSLKKKFSLKYGTELLRTQ